MASTSFELFKSNVCHRVKDIGDLRFICETLKSGKIRQFFDEKQYAQSLYLLAMVDYLCRENDLLICSDYRDIRRTRLDKPIYPQSVLAMSYFAGNDDAKKESWEDAIPEFKHFNIVEGEIRDVM